MSYDPGAGGQPKGGQEGRGDQYPPQGWGPPPQHPGYGPPPGYGGQPQQPAGYGSQPGHGPGAGIQGTQEANPFAALFDLSFSRFATPGLIRIIYIIGMVLLGLMWIGYVLTGFLSGSSILGLIALVGGAIFVVFAIAMLRVSLEFYYAVVRMSEDIHNRQ